MSVAPAAIPHQPSATVAVVDCDIHVMPPSVDVLLPYLDDHWREYIRQTAFKGASETSYPRNVPTSRRPDGGAGNGSAGPDLTSLQPNTGASSPGGVDGSAGSGLAALQQQVLDPQGVDIGILTCTYAAESIHNPDAAAAMAAAVNDWLIAEWLEREPRLRGTLVLPSTQPDLAAREIDRLGDHPGVVQVFLPVRSEAPYGNRRYHPIFAAAARHNLVVGLHFGGSPGNPPTPSGWPSYYLEEYVDMMTIFQSQVLSLIAEGVFERFPTLRVTLLESGVTWLPSWMWRIEKEWKGLRREIPWSRRLPSETIREHMRLTLPPIDAPTNPRQTQQILAALGSDDLLLYSSDYPHQHTAPGTGRALHGPHSAVEEALGLALPLPLVKKIMAGNARAWYRNLAPRPAPPD
jgi:uncharacterized protein